MYLTWSGYFEGVSDSEYFGVLLHRVMSAIVAEEGLRPILIPEEFIRFGERSRSVDDVSLEACENRDGFHIWYVHADTGGRNLAAGIASRSEAYRIRANELCGLPLTRTVIIAPRKETEAWVLADRDAVLSAFGVTARVDLSHLPLTPAESEGLADPKETINSFARIVNRKRYRSGVSFLYASIAQKQRIDILRQLASFQEFESNLRAALIDLGCIARR